MHTKNIGINVITSLRSLVWGWRTDSEICGGGASLARSTPSIPGHWDHLGHHDLRRAIFGSEAFHGPGTPIAIQGARILAAPPPWTQAAIQNIFIMIHVVRGVYYLSAVCVTKAMDEATFKLSNAMSNVKSR